LRKSTVLSARVTFLVMVLPFRIIGTKQQITTPVVPGQ